MFCLLVLTFLGSVESNSLCLLMGNQHIKNPFAFFCDLPVISRIAYFLFLIGVKFSWNFARYGKGTNLKEFKFRVFRSGFGVFRELFGVWVFGNLGFSGFFGIRELFGV